MSANTTTLTPEQREVIYEAWIAALRSGQYKQGRFRLERDGKFCCFGVLCHVLHRRPELGIKMHRSEDLNGVKYATPTSTGCIGVVPSSGAASELGLLVPMPGPGEYRSVEAEIMFLNDDRRASFAEIAQFIEGVVMPLLRLKGVLPSVSASTQQEALEYGTTLEQAESHAHICAKLAEEHKDDALLFAALTDAAAIIRDLLRDQQKKAITDAVRSDNAKVVFIDGVGAGRSSIESCRDGVQWILVGDRVYWPLSDSDTKRLQSACCGNGSFNGPTTSADS